jgi:hypothetical protein
LIEAIRQHLVTNLSEHLRGQYKFTASRNLVTPNGKALVTLISRCVDGAAYNSWMVLLNPGEAVLAIDDETVNLSDPKLVERVAAVIEPPGSELAQAVEEMQATHTLGAVKQMLSDLRQS